MLQSYCIAVAADMYVKVFQTILRKIPNDKISIKLINTYLSIVFGLFRNNKTYMYVLNNLN